MFLTTCTLLPPTFIQPHTRNHSLTRLGLYILTDTQHQIILLFTSPTRLRTNRHTRTGGAGGGAEQLSSHTQGPGEREQRRAARALSQGLLQGLGSRPIRARVTREGQGLLGLGLLGLGLLGLGLIGLGLGSGTGLGLGLGLWLGLVMLIALTTLVTRARVRVRGLLGLGLGLSRLGRLGLRPLQSQALPVQLQHAQRLRFGPLKALGVGLESVRVVGGLF